MSYHAGMAAPPAGPGSTGATRPTEKPKPSLPRRLVTSGDTAWRYATAGLRSQPDFVILGAQRGGTTSLYDWLSAHPRMAPASRKELHYFDVHYGRGPRWYRSQFPLTRSGRVTGEASPYMLYHPLAPGRAAADLPERTRFVVLLREPVERTLSHYWYSRRLKLWETEPLERALALEPERLAGETERVLRGERSFAHACFSYVGRSEYAGQLEAWFAAVGRDRVLVVESEAMYTGTDTRDRIADWLGLAPHRAAFPATNQSHRLDEPGPELRERLRAHFEPHNRRLFDLLGTELWTGPGGG